MKRIIITIPLLLGAILITGCASGHQTAGTSGSGSGGIDPITMAGIEQSNAAQDAANAAAAQAGIDQANAAAQAAANQAAADASAAASAAAAAAAANQ